MLMSLLIGYLPMRLATIVEAERVVIEQKKNDRSIGKQWVSRDQYLYQVMEEKNPEISS